MGQHRHGSVIHQVARLFAQGDAINRGRRPHGGRHAAKRLGQTERRVFSLRTKARYMDATIRYARWAKAEQGIVRLDRALQFLIGDRLQ